MSATRTRLAAVLLCAALALGGCTYRGLHRIAFQMPSHAAAETYDERTTYAHAWLGFADSTDPVDVSEFCPDGFAEVAHYRTPAQLRTPHPVGLVVALFAAESTVELRCLEEE